MLTLAVTPKGNITTRTYFTDPTTGTETWFDPAKAEQFEAGISRAAWIRQAIAEKLN